MTTPLRILFASTHCYADPSSGAAICTRDVLELLTQAGHDCRVLTTGVLDYERETPVEEVLRGLAVPVRKAGARLTTGAVAEVIDFSLAGVRVTLLPTRSSRADRAPDRDEGTIWLDLGEQVLDRFRPHLVLTYGGHPAGLDFLRRTRARGIATVFHLHNFAYTDRRTFEHVSAVVTPSEYAKRFYRTCVGVDSTVIPDPLRHERVVSIDADSKYVTFVNPQPAKGITVLARIACELQRRRPEIPLLVVEGRGGSEWLSRLPVDLSHLENLNRMANTPEPKDFWSVTRVALMPSLWRETLGRVAMEACANGVPMLASDRGALPETLGDAGFVFHVPLHYTPENAALPTPREVAPWVAVIEKLWDDPTFEASHRERALSEARRWEPSVVERQYAEFFGGLACR
ncbi:MAG: glycosyltransferase [Phycisphaerales bacterium]|nr:glycosyltransferase [Phycisphaerales bacterium]